VAVERLLARLERKVGKYAIPNLTNYIVGGMAIAFVLGYVRPQILPWLTLDLDAVRRGEVWRLVSYLFIPRSMSPWWGIMALSFTLFVGRNLESEWGTFKFNVYYLVGMLGTTLAAVLVGGGVGNDWLNLSLLFALATVFPDHEIMMLILPIKVKWLGLLSLVFLLYSAATGDWMTRVAIALALSNYLLFFAGHWRARLRERNQTVRQGARRAGWRESAPPPVVGKSCAICGARQDDGADIRVCSCEKCGRPRSLCLEHARNH
jgi:membrane associated rhomboid family serine protease